MLVSVLLACFGDFGDRQGVYKQIDTTQLLSFKYQHVPHPIGVYVHAPVENDLISTEILRTGTWDTDTASFLVDAFKQHPHALLLDLGANIGVFTVMTLLLGKRVISVEAQAQNTDMLRRTIKHNGIQGRDLTLINQPVSNTAGAIVSFQGPRENNGATNTMQLRKTCSPYQMGVTCGVTTTLDAALSYVRNQDIIVKMDLEGADCLALQGGSAFFAANRIVAITAERQPWTLQWPKTFGCNFDDEMHKIVTRWGVKPHYS
tara:strand:+ start:3086 stop:3868 length:783 start_codon:yes stop_codon:yes gene_type:complete